MPSSNQNESFYKIAQGVHQFQTEVYPQKAAAFKTLAKGQQPKVLFITCSDSRIQPHLITQTEPGDLFLVQNAGNIIPPHGSAKGGIGATIEYAVTVLQVEHIIVCGHTDCGAMKALLTPENLDAVPLVKQWLGFAETTRAISDANNQNLNAEERIDRCIHNNIAVQLDHLKTLPSVANKLFQNEITLHGWVYHIETGEIEIYNEDTQTFVCFKDAYPLNKVGAPHATV